jgi:polar amino acid transport system substrate-binding protein
VQPSRRQLLLLASACWLIPARAAAPLPDKLVVAMSATSYNSIQRPWLELIYHEAFRRLGIQLSIISLPTKRASVMADTGQIDGDLHRAHDYGGRHPNLVRVEFSHFPVTFFAYSKRDDVILADGWDSFNHTKLRVEYILGSAIAGAELGRRVPPEQLSTVTKVEVGMRKLLLDRGDVLIALDLNVEPLLPLPEFRDSGIHKVAQLGQVPCYLYLQKKHAALALKLVPVLTQLKREGLIEQYGRQARQDWEAGQPRAPSRAQK